MKTETRHPPISALLVADAMHQGVLTCERDAPLSEVAATMAREHVHCVVVESDSGEGGLLWGIVSDLDLVAACTVRDLDDQSAGGSAATPVVTVSPNESLGRAAQLMTEHNTAHLVVVDRERPIGVLSTIDIAAGLAGRSPGVRWRSRELR
jgi:CBS domain-containing protein